MLDIGDIAATGGMTKDIYDQLNAVLEPDLTGLSEEKRKPIEENWKKLSFAIAKGVINHITNNLEIKGVKVSINDVNTNVHVVTSCPSGAGSGTGTGTGTATGQQSNDGTGLVK
jgi:hypothetical protein